MKVSCYAALAEKQPLEPFEYDGRDPAGTEVEIDISHCGICYSDVHMIDNDVGISAYPFVPGHEIVGTVSRAGNRAGLKEGDRVGVGWQGRSCGHCAPCLGGHENLCDQFLQTATWSPYGGFASSIVVDGRFAIPLPGAVDPVTAGPLMCGGITVYSPIRNHASPSMRVGVIGIGGLGHLALQFAHAFGCEVTAFSTSPDKELLLNPIPHHQNPLKQIHLLHFLYFHGIEISIFH